MKSIDFDSGRIIGKSGKEYFIQANTLSVARYEKYLHYTPQVTFGLNFKELFDEHRKIYEATTNGSDVLNGLNVASTISYNMMEQIRQFGDNARRPAVIWFCALFINYEDENLGEWDESKMKKKIDDWDEYNVFDFFLLAKNLVPGLIDAYQELQEIGAKVAALNDTSIF